MSKPLAISALVVALLAPIAAGAAGAAEADERPVIVLTLADAVGPATSDYVARGVTEAAEQRAGLVVLRMDTAEILSGNSQVLHLRYISALHDIAGERSSTIVFPLPIEFLGALRPAGATGDSGS